MAKARRKNGKNAVAKASDLYIIIPGEVDVVLVLRVRCHSSMLEMSQTNAAQVTVNHAFVMHVRHSSDYLLNLPIVDH